VHLERASVAASAASDAGVVTKHVNVPWTMDDRYKLANYWWVVSEIIRRHPELQLEETYPMDGFYDCLTIHGVSNGQQVHIDLNRNGSVHVHPDDIGLAKADEFFTEADPHSIVKRIEHAAGVSAEGSVAPSTGRTLVYRVLAQVLTQLVTNKSAWGVRALTPVPQGHAISIAVPDPEIRTSSPLPSVFATPVDFEAFVISSGFRAVPRSGRFWALQRDGDVVAVLDTRGVVHTSASRIQLEPLYERVGRNLTQTVAVALESILP